MRSNAYISEKKTAIFMKKAIAEGLKLMTATVIAICVYMFLASIAAAERGYTGAVGGEGILTVVAFCGAYIFSDSIFG